LRSAVAATIVSAIAVLALARGARAIVPGHSSAMQQGGDSEDPHAAPASDNPYDEPSVRHPAAFARVSVPAQGGMLRLPGGHFTMGSSSPRAPANERPARIVAVGPFWMDRTEVTVGAFRSCVDARVCVRPTRSSAACTYDANDDDLPVSCVHWDQADAYCRFADKRLPTETEWEYAARGTLRVPFPWGGAASCANAVTLAYDQAARSCGLRPGRVGSHPAGASVFGVEDMSGNVEEWTGDWYAESLGPGPGPRAGAAHVLRGGGWLSPPALSRTTSRDWGSAMEAGPNVGFRCAKDAAPAR